MTQPRKLELLAPARNADIARQAILHGADAIYIGGPSHGARAAASNDIADIAAIVEYAHLFGVRVYVTLNTLIYDDEIRQVEDNIRRLYDIGVDALIVQDMGILRMDIPPIDLHASTQCDIRTPQKARFLAQAGFSQLVLPREMSLDEIRQIAEAVGPDTSLEAFVHGALCVCYSGDCQASWIAMGRSANRGECAQMCRLPYTLTDGDGNILLRDKHLLSLRDLNRLDDIERMAEVGISSFKIEGRLKDAAYIKQTVSAYRRQIDRLIARLPNRYMRSSYGYMVTTFEPDVYRAFNRGFTPYFIDGRPKQVVSMANIDTPKWTGLPVGRVIWAKGRTIRARIDSALNNGDGLGYFTPNGNFAGFRLNRVDGDKLHAASDVNVQPGTILYRNHDTATEAILSRPTAKRALGVTITAELNDSALTLKMSADNGISVTVSEEVTPDKASTAQGQQRQRVLTKLGGSNLVLFMLIDNIPDDVFIQASILTHLRQEAVSKLTAALLSSHQRRQRKTENRHALPHKAVLDYHDNVANRLAEQFYNDHGAIVGQRALETSGRDVEETVVMTTRYCIRRELGTCLLTDKGKNTPNPLYISNEYARYRLDFDCANCQMRVITDS